MSEPGQHITGEADVLVALEHAPLVESVLAAAGVTGVSATDSPSLGLSRLVLDAGAGAALAGMLPALLAEESGCSREEAAASLEAWPGAAAGAEHRQDPPVDVILRFLRAYFELRYAGWAPTMGKNRLVGEVTGGGGTVSFGGGPAPVPAAPGPARHGSAGLGVTVGVLDTALVPHGALAGGYLATSPDDLLVPRTTQEYAAGHATFVTGLVLTQAPAATVRARKVLDEVGEASSWDVANAIVELGCSGIDVLNLSFVCYTADGKPPLALSTAVDRLPPDVLVIACAGNHGDPRLELGDGHRKPTWPAALDDVVAVGSGRRSQGEPGYELSSFTPPGAAWIDVVTRGEDLLSTYFTGAGPAPAHRDFHGWATWSGTSFAAALVTGKVAAVAAASRLSARAAFEQIMAPLLARGEAPRVPRVPPFLDL